MDVKKKLMELLDNFNRDLSKYAGNPKFFVVDDNSELADHLIAHGVTVQEPKVVEIDQVNKWIPVTERLPEAETEVLILASRKIYSLKSHNHTTHHIITTGMYEDGTKRTEDSNWWWETDGFEYDEERDDYIIPEGWWEYKHYNGDEQHNYAVDDEVTHWMPLPEPPKEG